MILFGDTEAIKIEREGALAGDPPGRHWVEGGKGGAGILRIAT